MLKVGDYVLTPKEPWVDKAFSGDIGGIPRTFLGIVSKVYQTRTDEDGTKYVELGRGDYPEYWFQDSVLKKVELPVFKVGDKVRIRMDGEVTQDVYWVTSLEATLKRNYLFGIPEVMTIVSQNKIVIRYPTGQRCNFQPTSLIPYVKVGVKERLSTHIKHKEELIPLLTLLEEETEHNYVATRKMPMNGDENKDCVLFFDPEKKEVTIKYPNQEPLTIQIQKDMIKSYRLSLADKNKRFRGLTINREAFTSLLKDHYTSWKGSIGDVDVRNLNQERRNVVEYDQAIKNEAPLLKEAIDTLVFFNEIEKEGRIIPKPLLTVKENERQHKEYYGKHARDYVLYRDKSKRAVETLEKRVKEKKVLTNEEIAQDYDIVKDLYESKIIEEVGVDELGMLYVIFSPLITTYNRLKSCPEHGPQCSCLASPRRYFYLGRVKVSFHHPNRCPKGTCDGFHFKSLTWPKCLIHPHIRSDETCRGNCFNGYQDIKQQVLVSGKLSQMIMFIRQFLTNYNPHHGLIGVENFKFNEIVDKTAPKGVKDETFDIKFLEKMFGELTVENQNVDKKTLALITARGGGDAGDDEDDEDDDGDDM